MHDGMQYDPIQGQGHDFFKVGNQANGRWQLTTDSLTRALYLNLIGPDF